MLENHCIGTVKGPGETPHEFTFMAPDPERRVKHGEFVYYLAHVDGEERQIIGTRDRAASRFSLFPDSFMADPTVPPHEVAALLGYDSEDSELFEITVAVLGYHSAVMGDFINPRVPPAGGSPIYIAGDELLTEVLSKRKKGERGSAHLGSLLSREPDAVPVALDVRGFTSTHLAIIASTGSGKSYLAGVLLEELFMPYNRACRADRRSARRISARCKRCRTRPEFSRGQLQAQGAHLPARTTVRVRIDSLTLADLRYLLPNLSEKMQYQLSRAL